MSLWPQVATTTVEVELTAGVWTDISQYVLVSRGQPLEANRGRQTDLARIEPSRLTMLLNNADGRFTVGNSLSPYFPNWREGKRIRWRETLGPKTFDIYLGYLQAPDAEVYTEGLEQTILVNLVDRQGRLAKARTFISTLAEHILYVAGSALQAYYPMGGSSLPFFDVTANARAAMTTVGYSQPTAPTSGAPKLTPAGGGTIPGDDLRLARLDVATGTSGGGNTVVATGYTIAATYGGGGGPTSINIGSGFLTVVAWIYPDFLETDYATLLSCDIQEESPAGATTLILGRQASTDGTYPNRWLAQAIGTLNVDLPGPITTNKAPYPIAIQYSPSAATMEFWAGSERTSGSLTGSPAATNYLYSLTAADVGYVGGIGHVQVYVGSSSAWGRTQFLAQRDMAWNGLAWQRTDERVRAVLKYAGVTDAELLLDPGTTYMPAAKLAGQKPSALASTAAVDTERGRLFVDGRGLIVMHNRTRTTYNV